MRGQTFFLSGPHLHSFKSSRLASNLPLLISPFSSEALPIEMARLDKLDRRDTFSSARTNQVPLTKSRRSTDEELLILASIGNFGIQRNLTRRRPHLAGFGCSAEPEKRLCAIVTTLMKYDPNLIQRTHRHEACALSKTCYSDPSSFARAMTACATARPKASPTSLSLRK